MIRQRLPQQLCGAALDELYQYLMDNCLSYHFLDNQNYHVANTGIEELFYVGSNQAWRVGSFTLSDDWSYFYDA